MCSSRSGGRDGESGSHRAEHGARFRWRGACVTAPGTATDTDAPGPCSPLGRASQVSDGRSFFRQLQGRSEVLSLEPPFRVLESPHGAVPTSSLRTLTNDEASGRPVGPETAPLRGAESWAASGASRDVLSPTREGPRARAPPTSGVSRGGKRRLGNESAAAALGHLRHRAITADP